MRTTVSNADISSIQQLRETVKGRVIGPREPGYDDARAVYYSGIDRRPTAIVKPVDAADVARVVSLAREAGLELAVRSGGHSLAGHGVSDGGIVLDLSAMRALDIDVEQRTAWTQTGLTTGEYTAAVGAHGLATGFGDTPSVGVGGITLGGGVGFLHRKHGLTIDSLLAADVVTADGELVRTDSETHPDLFWAIRGGGGNFGVATRFRFRLDEVSSALAGMLILPATPDVIASFITRACEAPDELSGMVNIMRAPPMPLIPAEHRGRLILMALLAYSGDVDAGEKAIAPLRSLATPIVDLIRPMRYPELYEQGEAPRMAAVSAHPFFLDSLDRSAAETIVDHLASPSAAFRVAQFRVLGGAVMRVTADATAFAHRNRRTLANVAAAYEHPEEATEARAWVDRFARELRQGEAGAYVGFLGDEGEARIREAYPGSTWDRLRAVKASYDPTNLFRVNQNIPPARER